MSDDDVIGPSPTLDDALIDQLEHGPLHRFADYATLTDVIPGSGAGVYTIWDDAGGWSMPGSRDATPPGRDLRVGCAATRAADAAATSSASTSPTTTCSPN